MSSLFSPEQVEAIRAMIREGLCRTIDVTTIGGPGLDVHIHCDTAGVLQARVTDRLAGRVVASFPGPVA